MKSAFFILTLLITFNVYSLGEIELVFQAPSEYEKHQKEYEEVWKKNKTEILKLLENYTHLSFKEELDEIKVNLIDGPSYSGVPYKSPMQLRYSYNKNVKLATLIHELSHRLIFPISKENPGLDTHWVINLFLYDIWFDMKGEKFANSMVEIESNRAARYERIWKKTLELTKEERSIRYRSYLEDVATTDPRN